MQDTFTLLDGDRTRTMRADLEGGRVRLAAEDVRDALGWELKPEGLCRDAVCIPVRDGDALVDAAGLCLERLAELLDRPLALDADERCAALLAGHGARGAELASLEAPDFELPDLSGATHRLSDHRGKKVLLIAYASW
jgi:hypothetical protein